MRRQSSTLGRLTCNPGVENVPSGSECGFSCTHNHQGNCFEPAKTFQFQHPFLFDNNESVSIELLAPGSGGCSVGTCSVSGMSVNSLLGANVPIPIAQFLRSSYELINGRCRDRLSDDHCSFCGSIREDLVPMARILAISPPSTFSGLSNVSFAALNSSQSAPYAHESGSASGFRPPNSVETGVCNYSAAKFSVGANLNANSAQQAGTGVVVSLDDSDVGKANSVLRGDERRSSVTAMVAESDGTFFGQNSGNYVMAAAVHDCSTFKCAQPQKHAQLRRCVFIFQIPCQVLMSAASVCDFFERTLFLGATRVAKSLQRRAWSDSFRAGVNGASRSWRGVSIDDIRCCSGWGDGMQAGMRCMLVNELLQVPPPFSAPGLGTGFGCNSSCSSGSRGSSADGSSSCLFLGPKESGGGNLHEGRVYESAPLLTGALPLLLPQSGRPHCSRCYYALSHRCLCGRLRNVSFPSQHLSFDCNSAFYACSSIKKSMNRNVINASARSSELADATCGNFDDNSSNLMCMWGARLICMCTHLDEVRECSFLGPTAVSPMLLAAGTVNGQLHFWRHSEGGSVFRLVGRIDMPLFLHRSGQHSNGSACIRGSDFVNDGAVGVEVNKCVCSGNTQPMRLSLLEVDDRSTSASSASYGIAGDSPMGAVGRIHILFIFKRSNCAAVPTESSLGLNIPCNGRASTENEYGYIRNLNHKKFRELSEVNIESRKRANAFFVGAYMIDGLSLGANGPIVFQQVAENSQLPFSYLHVANILEASFSEAAYFTESIVLTQGRIPPMPAGCILGAPVKCSYPLYTVNQTQQSLLRPFGSSLLTPSLSFDDKQYSGVFGGSLDWGELSGFLSCVIPPCKLRILTDFGEEISVLLCPAVLQIESSDVEESEDFMASSRIQLQYSIRILASACELTDLSLQEGARTSVNSLKYLQISASAKPDQLVPRSPRIYFPAICETQDATVAAISLKREPAAFLHAVAAAVDEETGATLKSSCSSQSFQYQFAFRIRFVSCLPSHDLVGALEERSGTVFLWRLAAATLGDAPVCCLQSAPFFRDAADEFLFDSDVNDVHANQTSQPFGVSWFAWIYCEGNFRFNTNIEAEKKLDTCADFGSLTADPYAAGKLSKTSACIMNGNPFRPHILCLTASKRRFFLIELHYGLSLFTILRVRLRVYPHEFPFISQKLTHSIKYLFEGYDWKNIPPSDKLIVLSAQMIEYNFSSDNQTLFLLNVSTTDTEAGGEFYVLLLSISCSEMFSSAPGGFFVKILGIWKMEGSHSKNMFSQGMQMISANNGIDKPPVDIRASFKSDGMLVIASALQLRKIGSIDCEGVVEENICAKEKNEADRVFVYTCDLTALWRRLPTDGVSAHLLCIAMLPQRGSLSIGNISDFKILCGVNNSGMISAFTMCGIPLPSDFLHRDKLQAWKNSRNLQHQSIDAPVTRLSPVFTFDIPTPSADFWCYEDDNGKFGDSGGRTTLSSFDISTRILDNGKQVALVKRISNYFDVSYTDLFIFVEETIGHATSVQEHLKMGSYKTNDETTWICVFASQAPRGNRPKPPSSVVRSSGNSPEAVLDAWWFPDATLLLQCVVWETSGNNVSCHTGIENLSASYCFRRLCINSFVYDGLRLSPSLFNCWQPWMLHLSVKQSAQLIKIGATSKPPAKQRLLSAMNAAADTIAALEEAIRVDEELENRSEAIWQRRAGALWLQQADILHGYCRPYHPRVLNFLFSCYLYGSVKWVLKTLLRCLMAAGIITIDGDANADRGDAGIGIVGERHIHCSVMSRVRNCRSEECRGDKFCMSCVQRKECELATLLQLCMAPVALTIVDLLAQQLGDQACVLMQANNQNPQVNAALQRQRRQGLKDLSVYKRFCTMCLPKYLCPSKSGFEMAAQVRLSTLGHIGINLESSYKRQDFETVNTGHSERTQYISNESATWDDTAIDDWGTAPTTSKGRKSVASAALFGDSDGSDDEFDDLLGLKGGKKVDTPIAESLPFIEDLVDSDPGARKVEGNGNLFKDVVFPLTDVSLTANDYCALEVALKNRIPGLGLADSDQQLLRCFVLALQKFEQSIRPKVATSLEEDFPAAAASAAALAEDIAEGEGLDLCRTLPKVSSPFCPSGRNENICSFTTPAEAAHAIASSFRTVLAKQHLPTSPEASRQRFLFAIHVLDIAEAEISSQRQRLSQARKLKRQHTRLRRAESGAVGTPSDESFAQLEASIAVTKGLGESSVLELEALSLLSSESICWALHGDAEDEFLDVVIKSCKSSTKDSKLLWSSLRKRAVGFWLRKPINIRRICDLLLKDATILGMQSLQNESKYVPLKSNPTMGVSVNAPFGVQDKLTEQGASPSDWAALWAAGSGKINLMKSSFKAQGNLRVVEFLSNDFTESRWRDAANKNAFKLLEQKRYHLALAFFMIAKNLRNVVEVCCRQLQDIQLALYLCGLSAAMSSSSGQPLGACGFAPAEGYHDRFAFDHASLASRISDCTSSPEAEYHRLLIQRLIPTAEKAGDPWLQFAALWLAGAYGDAFASIVYPYAHLGLQNTSVNVPARTVSDIGEESLLGYRLSHDDPRSYILKRKNILRKQQAEMLAELHPEAQRGADSGKPKCPGVFTFEQGALQHSSVSMSLPLFRQAVSQLIQILRIHNLLKERGPKVIVQHSLSPMFHEKTLITRSESAFSSVGTIDGHENKADFTSSKRITENTSEFLSNSGLSDSNIDRTYWALTDPAAAAAADFYLLSVTYRNEQMPVLAVASACSFLAVNIVRTSACAETGDAGQQPCEQTVVRGEEDLHIDSVKGLGALNEAYVCATDSSIVMPVEAIAAIKGAIESIGGAVWVSLVLSSSINAVNPSEGPEIKKGLGVDETAGQPALEGIDFLELLGIHAGIFLLLSCCAANTGKSIEQQETKINSDDISTCTKEKNVLMMFFSSFTSCVDRLSERKDLALPVLISAAEKCRSLAARSAAWRGCCGLVKNHCDSDSSWCCPFAASFESASPLSVLAGIACTVLEELSKSFTSAQGYQMNAISFIRDKCPYDQRRRTSNISLVQSVAGYADFMSQSLALGACSCLGFYANTSSPRVIMDLSQNIRAPASVHNALLLLFSLLEITQKSFGHFSNMAMENWNGNESDIYDDAWALASYHVGLANAQLLSACRRFFSVNSSVMRHIKCREELGCGDGRDEIDCSTVEGLTYDASFQLPLAIPMLLQVAGELLASPGIFPKSVELPVIYVCLCQCVGDMQHQFRATKGKAESNQSRESSTVKKCYSGNLDNNDLQKLACCFFVSVVGVIFGIMSVFPTVLSAGLGVLVSQSTLFRIDNNALGVAAGGEQEVSGKHSVGEKPSRYRGKMHQDEDHCPVNGLVCDWNQVLWFGRAGDENIYVRLYEIIAFCNLLQGDPTRLEWMKGLCRSLVSLLSPVHVKGVGNICSSGTDKQVFVCPLKQSMKSVRQRNSAPTHAVALATCVVARTVEALSQSMVHLQAEAVKTASAISSFQRDMDTASPNLIECRKAERQSALDIAERAKFLYDSLQYLLAQQIRPLLYKSTCYGSWVLLPLLCEPVNISADGTNESTRERLFELGCQLPDALSLLAHRTHHGFAKSGGIAHLLKFIEAVAGNGFANLWVALGCTRRLRWMLQQIPLLAVPTSGSIISGFSKAENELDSSGYARSQPAISNALKDTPSIKEKHLSLRYSVTGSVSTFDKRVSVKTAESILVRSVRPTVSAAVALQLHPQQLKSVAIRQCHFHAFEIINAHGMHENYSHHYRYHQHQNGRLQKFVVPVSVLLSMAASACCSTSSRRLYAVGGCVSGDTVIAIRPDNSEGPMSLRTFTIPRLLTSGGSVSSCPIALLSAADALAQRLAGAERALQTHYRNPSVITEKFSVQKGVRGLHQSSEFVELTRMLQHLLPLGFDLTDGGGFINLTPSRLVASDSLHCETGILKDTLHGRIKRAGEESCNLNISPRTPDGLCASPIITRYQGRRFGQLLLLDTSIFVVSQVSRMSALLRLFALLLRHVESRGAKNDAELPQSLPVFPYGVFPSLSVLRSRYEFTGVIASHPYLPVIAGVLRNPQKDGVVIPVLRPFGPYARSLPRQTCTSVKSVSPQTDSPHECITEGNSTDFGQITDRTVAGEPAPASQGGTQARAPGMTPSQERGSECEKRITKGLSGEGNVAPVVGLPQRDTSANQLDHYAVEKRSSSRPTRSDSSNKGILNSKCLAWSGNGDVICIAEKRGCVNVFSVVRGPLLPHSAAAEVIASVSKVAQRKDHALDFDAMEEFAPSLRKLCSPMISFKPHNTTYGVQFLDGCGVWLITLGEGVPQGYIDQNPVLIPGNASTINLARETYSARGHGPTWENAKKEGTKGTQFRLRAALRVRRRLHAIKVHTSMKTGHSFMQRLARSRLFGWKWAGANNTLSESGAILRSRRQDNGSGTSTRYARRNPLLFGKKLREFYSISAETTAAASATAAELDEWWSGATWARGFLSFGSMTSDADEGDGGWIPGMPRMPRVNGRCICLWHLLDGVGAVCPRLEAVIPCDDQLHLRASANGGEKNSETVQVGPYFDTFNTHIPECFCIAVFQEGIGVCTICLSSVSGCAGSCCSANLISGCCGRNCGSMRCVVYGDSDGYVHAIDVSAQEEVYRWKAHDRAVCFCSVDRAPSLLSPTTEAWLVTGAAVNGCDNYSGYVIRCWSIIGVDESGPSLLHEIISSDTSLITSLKGIDALAPSTDSSRNITPRGFLGTEEILSRSGAAGGLMRMLGAGKKAASEEQDSSDDLTIFPMGGGCMLTAERDGALVFNRM